MFRLFFTYILPLAAPTALYFLWLWWRRRRQGPEAENNDDQSVPWVVLLGSGLSLLVATLLAFTFGSGGDLESKYVPPSFEGGKIKPGEFRK